MRLPTLSLALAFASLLLAANSHAADPAGGWQALGQAPGQVATDMAWDGQRVLVSILDIDSSNFAAPYRPGVHLSEDGGASLQNVSGPLAANGSNGIEAVAFAGPALVAARGNTTWRSSDGGQNWSQGQPAPEAILSLHFADAATGFATGQNGMIARTDDAGQTWEPVSTPTSAPLRGQFWRGRDVGFAWGNTQQRTPGPDGVVTVGAGTLLRTTDGGASWQEMHAFDGVVVGPAYFLDATTGWVAWATRESDNGMAATPTLARTTDGGTTLEELTLPDEVGALQVPIVGSQPLKVSWIRGVAFANSRVGRLVALVHLGDSESSESGGGGGTVSQRTSSFRILDISTTDGGENWTWTGLGTLSASFSGVDGPDDREIIRTRMTHLHDGRLLGEDGRVWHWADSCSDDDQCLGSYTCSNAACQPSGADAGNLDSGMDPIGGAGAGGGNGAGGVAPRDRDIPGEGNEGCGCSAAPGPGAPFALAFLAFALMLLRKPTQPGRRR